MAKATIANGTNGIEPTGAIHLTLQGKGGVGKSLVASVLAQYLRGKGKEVRCIDTDPVNRTFAQYSALGADRLNLRDEHNRIEQRAFDSLIERFLTEDAALVGLVTDRDLVVRVLADGDGPQTPVRQACSPDLVTIAVPTSRHLEAARAAIARGVHVLVEKPLAESLEVGQEMIGLARARGVVLAVGHVERHNPAIGGLSALIEDGTVGPVFEIRAERVGPFPGRVQDVGVVLDLATHDIDG